MHLFVLISFFKKTTKKSDLHDLAEDGAEQHWAGFAPAQPGPSARHCRSSPHADAARGLVPSLVVPSQNAASALPLVHSSCKRHQAAKRRRLFPGALLPPGQSNGPGSLTFLTRAVAPRRGLCLHDLHHCVPELFAVLLPAVGMQLSTSKHQHHPNLQYKDLGYKNTRCVST